jgi:hypothetical protein
LEQVREFIRHASKEDLQATSDIIQSRWKHLNAELSFTFKRGDKVSLEGKRRDGYRRIHAEVVATDGKWVYLKTQNYVEGLHRGTWDLKASPTLLRKEV